MLIVLKTALEAMHHANHACWDFALQHICKEAWILMKNSAGLVERRQPIFQSGMLFHVPFDIVNTRWQSVEKNKSKETT